MASPSTKTGMLGLAALVLLALMVCVGIQISSCSDRKAEVRLESITEDLARPTEDVRRMPIGEASIEAAQAPQDTRSGKAPTPSKEQINRLIDELIDAHKRLDGKRIRELRAALISAGQDAVIALRDRLVNEIPLFDQTNLQHVWSSITEILSALASKRTGRQLLDGFSMVDMHPQESIQPFHRTTLDIFIRAIAVHPSQSIVSRAIGLLEEAKLELVKQYLIKLLGRLMDFDPSIRERLAAILKGDPSSKARKEAALALGHTDARKSTADFIDTMTSILDSPKLSGGEITSIMHSLGKAIPIADFLDLVGEAIDRAKNQNNVILLGRQLARSYPNNMDEIFLRLKKEQSPNRQILYLNAIHAAGSRDNWDPRAPEAAFEILTTSSDRGVQSIALYAAIAHTVDQNSAVDLTDRAVSMSPNLRHSAIGALLNYCIDHPEGVVAARRVGEYVEMGNADERLSFIQEYSGLRQSAKRPLAWLGQILNDLSQKDPDPGVREAAGEVYNRLQQKK